jgi:hypothetical protein
MRIAICALSAVLLSGCSWLGGVNNVFGGQGGQNAYGHYTQKGVAVSNHKVQAHNGYSSGGTYGHNFGGGFPQQAQFGQPQNVTGGYGSHAGNVQHANSYGGGHSGPKMRKPKLRGSLSAGFERSFSGNALSFDPGDNTGVDPAFINAQGLFGFVQPSGFSGSPNEGLTISSDLTAVETSRTAPSISFDDIHATPFRIAGGVEYILTPKTTVFGNVGYTTAEGNEGGGINIIGNVIGTVTNTGYRQNVASGSNTIERSLRNAPIGQVSFDFSDLERYDFEVGARHYFNPIMQSKLTRSLTPFVSASVGAAHYNDVTFKAQTQLLELHDYLIDDETIFGPVLNNNAPMTLTESKWVPTGQLNAGLEWQATPRTAIAFETGIKFEGARDRFMDPNLDPATINASDYNGDNNISVPFTIRGSYNF